ncbi:MAG: putative Ig domain-containing protein [Verrucomicrobiae bacterium]|nr:putative Ig domain-containing protein [Verrucomicrobiae bacterium]
MVKAGRGPVFLGGDNSQRADGTVTIDDVRIWDRALSRADIMARKTLALSGNEPGLVAWYPLDGSTRDASGNGHHGTLLYKEAFVAGVTGSPVVAVPAITSATILNGTVGSPLAYGIVSVPAATSFSAMGLPDGLEIDTASGMISGTPATAGIYSVPVTATGSGGTANLTLTVNIQSGETGVFDNNNIAGVQSAPPQPTTFTLDFPTLITYVMDYHYFNNGTPPGTIALRHSDGTVYGPWQSEGRIGQGGVSNAYWEVWPMVSLPAGSYTVIDSSPATWSWNAQSQSSGISTIKGIPNGQDGTALLTAWASANGLTGASAAPEADPDGDNRPNWIEAALGANPMRFDPAPPHLSAVTVGTEHAVAYTIGAGGIGVPGIDHVVNGARIYLEASTSLNPDSWSRTVENLDIAAAEKIDNGDGTETVVIPLRQGQLGATPLFIREHFTRATSE